MSRLSGKAGAVLVGLQTIEDCEDAWNEQVIGDVTASLDNSDYKVGSGSAKFVVAAAFATGLIGSEAVASMDLTTYTTVMAWVKSSVALNAGDWRIMLDDTALCASVLENLSIPALDANSWKYVKIALATPANLGAIISVGVYQNVDKGAMNFWIDHVQAAKSVAGIKSWTLDQKMEVQDVTGFDSSSNRVFVPTVKGWSGSFEGYKDGAPITIGTVIGLELQESATATQQYRGTAIITGFSPKVSVENVVMYSYTFQGVHGLEIATA